MKKITKKTYMRLAGAFLLIDGIASLLYYRKAKDKLPHIGRSIRSLIGISLLSGK